MLDMKKSFHVFFLFTLMALFAVNAAWATCPIGFEEEAGSGDCYVNMPKNYDIDIHIPAELTSFKVYDDGGKDGIYSSITNGGFMLYAPAGYKIQITGSIDIAYNTRFGIEYYNGYSPVYPVNKYCEEQEGCIEDIAVDPESIYYVFLQRNQGGEIGSHAGVDLTVTLVHHTEMAEATELSNEGGLHIDMPKTGAKTLAIPDNVVSFNVYDDGGKADVYSNSSDGFLVLTAPEGKKLLLTGTMVTEKKEYDNLTVYDGDISNQKLLESVGPENSGVVYDIGSVLSSGRTLTLGFMSDVGGTYDGLNLNVLVVSDMDIPNTIKINQASGGTARTFVSSDEVSSATAGTKVELIVELEVGFLLQDVIVACENGLISVNRDGWPLSNTATFIMPGTVVNITPVIVPSSEVYVNMPKNKTERMDVPAGGTFHIYSDGGKDGAYSNNADGTLILHAPSDYVLQLSGNIKTQAGNDYLVVYDGNEYGRIILKKGSSASDGATFDIGTLVSSGQYMTINFKSDAAENYVGFDLVVSAVSPSGHDVVVNGLGKNGTLNGKTSGILPGEKVNLTVAPNDGYLLDGVVATDKWGNALEVTGGNWYPDSRFSFTMPSSDVAVSVVLSNEERHVNLPSDGTTKDFCLAATWSSLKVYDDGGKDGIYSSWSNGEVALLAPVGYKIRIIGSIDVAYGTYFGIKRYDEEKGSWERPVERDCKDAEGCSEDIEVDPASGYTIYLYGKENGSHAGIDFTVTFVHQTEMPEATELSDDGEPYINMPKAGAKTLAIPDNVESFKVYDDGGKADEYSLSSDGFLVLTAPEGKKLLLTGTMVTEKKYDNLTVYDGDISNQKLLDSVGSESSGVPYDIGAVLSSGRTLTLWFMSNAGDRYDGLDLKVSVVEPAQYAAVTVVEDETHKKYGFIDGMYNGADTIKIPSPIAVDTVIFKREFSTQGYSTIMLPFGIEQAKVDGIGQVLEFDGVSEVDGELQVDMVVHNGDLEANHPYMLRLSKEKLTFHGGVTLNSMSDPAIRKGDWVFHGTLAKRVWNKDDPELSKVYGFSAEERTSFKIGDFVKFGARSWIRPLRAYMIKDPVPVPLARRYAYDWTSSLDTETTIDSLPERIKVVIIERGEDSEEHTTVIGHINTRTGEFTMERNYDLKGRKLNGKPKARGAYYGKKVLVK